MKDNILKKITDERRGDVEIAEKKISAEILRQQADNCVHHMIL